MAENKTYFSTTSLVIATVCAYAILSLCITHQGIFFPFKSLETGDHELSEEADASSASSILFKEKEEKVVYEGNVKKLDTYERIADVELSRSRFSDTDLKLRLQKDDKSKDQLSFFKRRKDRLKRSVTEISSNGFSFSKWSAWSECDSTDCETPGQQRRSRNCYGTNIAEREDHPCKYDNLVRTRPCYHVKCKNITNVEIGWSTWAKWSECSITCGKDGYQTRIRNCFILGDNKVPKKRCPARTTEKRSCQYSVSCPTWDSWSTWSPCSQSCGEGGGTYRKRSCVAYRYFDVNEIEENPLDISNNRNDLNVNSAIKVENQTSFMKSNMLKQDVEMTVFMNKNEIFIVDTARLSNMKAINIKEESFSKVDLPADKCATQNVSVVEKKSCIERNRCPSKWGAWSKWTRCQPHCGAGMSKRERKCIQNNINEPCSGRRFLYRRCYSAPCWSQWVEVETCSASCGAGLVKRRRKCRSKNVPPYKCFGPIEDFENCKIKSCEDDSWTNWSEYSECSVSCNGGFQYRNRTCMQENCQGSSNEIKLCNRHRCPSWERWGPYSCCSVTCGQGTRERQRGCVRGKVGDLGCNGTSTETHPCYRPPCNDILQMTHEIGADMQCGVRPRATLKNAVILRIFGGKISVPHGWPWQASWQHRISERSKWKHSCGGSLIHPRWVLTAGHCIRETAFPVFLSDPGLWWSVVLGMDKLYKDGTRYFADRIYVHEKYAREVVTINDVALIKLREMVPITEKISPICLPGLKKPEPGEHCIVSGWGLTGPNAAHSEVLLEAQVPVVGFNKCQTLGEYYRHFLSRNMHMCAGNPIDVTGDSCTGDSGGPLSCKNGTSWYLAAVTSFGFAECGTPGNLGIYTEINHYQDWIKNITQLYTYDEC